MSTGAAGPLTVSKRVIYSGWVQGVGFRYTARHLARGFRVGGFVRNLPGGDVELVAEGPAGEVDAFLKAVSEHMAGYIEDATVKDAAPGGYRDFGIRY